VSLEMLSIFLFSLLHFRGAYERFHPRHKKGFIPVKKEIIPVLKDIIPILMKDIIPIMKDIIPL
jgi:hypothetical protein